MTEPTWLDKVSKLLAMAEGTDNPAEAEAFSAKAEALMLKYAIDQAMLDAARKPEEREKIVTAKVPQYAPYVSPKRALLHNVGLVFNVQSIFHEAVRYTAKDPTGYSTLIGFASDVEKVEILVTSLMIQQARAVAVARPPYRANIRSFRHSFALGFTNVVIDRVRKAYAQAKQEAASTGTDLVLFDRKRLVQAEYDAMFPDARKGSKVKASNLQGYRDGRVAGERADLSQTRIGTSRTGIAR